MKNIVLFFSLIISSTSFGAIDTLEATSKIKDVTVFFSGAQISGKLLWNIELNANEKKELKFNYLVKYPKFSNIKL